MVETTIRLQNPESGITLGSPIYGNDKTQILSVTREGQSNEDSVLKLFTGIHKTKEFDRENEIANSLKGVDGLPAFYGETEVVRNIRMTHENKDQVEQGLIYEKIIGQSINKFIETLEDQSFDSKRKVAVDILTQIHTLSQAAKDEGYYLTDIKPDNFIVQKNSEGNIVVKMVDFGAFISNEDKGSIQTTDGYAPLDIKIKGLTGENLNNVEYDRILSYALSSLAYDMLKSNSQLTTLEEIASDSDGKFTYYVPDIMYANSRIQFLLPDRSIPPHIYNVLNNAMNSNNNPTSTDRLIAELSKVQEPVESQEEVEHNEMISRLGKTIYSIAYQNLDKDQPEKVVSDEVEIIDNIDGLKDKGLDENSLLNAVTVIDGEDYITYFPKNIEGQIKLVAYKHKEISGLDKPPHQDLLLRLTESLKLSSVNLNQFSVRALMNNKEEFNAAFVNSNNRARNVFMIRSLLGDLYNSESLRSLPINELREWLEVNKNRIIDPDNSDREVVRIFNVN